MTQIEDLHASVTIEKHSETGRELTKDIELVEASWAFRPFLPIVNGAVRVDEFYNWRARNRPHAEGEEVLIETHRS